LLRPLTTKEMIEEDRLERRTEALRYQVAEVSSRKQHSREAFRTLSIVSGLLATRRSVQILLSFPFLAVVVNFLVVVSILVRNNAESLVESL
jgi:hypothetical protein